MKRLLAGIAALGILASVSACVVHETTPPPAGGYHQQRDIAARINDQQARIDQECDRGSLRITRRIVQGT